MLPLAFSGCEAPNSGFHQMPLAQAEAYRHYTQHVEQEDRDADNIERLRRAEAAEVATRHAPTNVSNTTVFAPHF